MVMMSRITLLLLLLLELIMMVAEAWTMSTTGARHFFRAITSATNQLNRGNPLYTSTIDDSLLEDAKMSVTSSNGTGKVGMNRKPVKGDVVTVFCRMKPEGDFVPDVLIDGVVLHDEDAAAKLSFVLYGGNYLPGLHELVASMLPLQRVAKISLDAGWGARNPTLVATLTYADAGVDASQIQLNGQLDFENGWTCVVNAVTADNFTIDANLPLAGASYLADVELVAVEAGPPPVPYTDDADDSHRSSSRYEVATFALGCFWSAELAFMREPGVVGTCVGYTQGLVANPSYDQVCSGTTGHTEAVLVSYDPTIVTYDKLVHAAMDQLGENKYLLNQVGNDKGTQYRHGIYYHTAAQKRVAETAIAQYGKDCATECQPATEWYPAEDSHQQYLLKGGQSARKGDTMAIRCYG